MRRRPRDRRWLGIALLAAIPLLAACTISNDPDGWAPPIAAEVHGRPVIIARVEDDRIGAIDLDRADPVVWTFPGLAAGRAESDDDDRPFPGLDAAIDAQGFYGAPAVIGTNADEFVIADHNDGVVYAIRRDGSSARVLLDTGVPVIAGIVVADDARTIFVATTDERVYAIDSENPPLSVDDSEAFVWVADAIEGRIWGTPALAHSDAHGPLLIVPTMAGQVVGLRADTGETVWTFRSGAGIASDVAVDGGLAFFGGFDRTFYALDIESGDLRWSAEGAHWFWTSALAVNGAVFAGDLHGAVWAWDAQTGAALWPAPFQAGDRIRAQPALTSAGDLVIITREGTLLAVDPASGDQRWGDPDNPLRTSNKVFATPLILDDDSLVISDDQGVLWRSRVGSGRVCQIYPERNLECERLLDADRG
jgi:outer membrane protein assembly factor BamB